MWIKIEQALPNKPEVFLLAQRLGIKKPEVVGHLVSLWLWADQVTDNGTIIGNREIIDEITQPEFANALIDVGWLDICENELHFANFERHNGSSAKRRSINARKVADYRKRKQADETQKPKSVTKPLLEENRIEEKKVIGNNISAKRIDYSKVTDSWNMLNQPKVERVTEKRKKAIRLLLKEFTQEDCDKVFSKIPNIPYMQGKNEHGWIASFDYVIRPDKFVKILEGTWDKQKQQGTHTTEYNEWTQ